MSAALKVLIADDESPARNRMRALLADRAREFATEVVAEAANGVEALEAMESRAPDVLLLDIRMPKMDGIEVAQHLQKLNAPPAVIFTSAYDIYAMQAFEVNAVDYLLKPVRGEKLLAALKKARRISPAGLQTLQTLAGPPRYLSIVERGKILLVPLDDVLYLRAELKYVTVRTLTREYLLEESLTQLEAQYPDFFLRIHRNCLVARKALAGFERSADEASGWVAVLRDSPDRLAVSRRQIHVVKSFRRASGQ